LLTSRFTRSKADVRYAPDEADRRAEALEIGGLEMVELHVTTLMPLALEWAKRA